MADEKYNPVAEKQYTPVLKIYKTSEGDKETYKIDYAEDDPMGVRSAETNKDLDSEIKRLFGYNSWDEYKKANLEDLTRKIKRDESGKIVQGSTVHPFHVAYGFEEFVNNFDPNSYDVVGIPAGLLNESFEVGHVTHDPTDPEAYKAATGHEVPDTEEGENLIDKAVDWWQGLGQGWQLAISLIDPTGVTSWGDVEIAAEMYKKDPSKENKALLALAILSAVPLFGKFAAVGKTDDIVTAIVKLKDEAGSALTTAQRELFDRAADVSKQNLQKKLKKGADADDLINSAEAHKALKKTADDLENIATTTGTKADKLAAKNAQKLVKSSAKQHKKIIKKNLPAVSRAIENISTAATLGVKQRYRLLMSTLSGLGLFGLGMAGLGLDPSILDIPGDRDGEEPDAPGGEPIQDFKNRVNQNISFINGIVNLRKQFFGDQGSEDAMGKLGFFKYAMFYPRATLTNKDVIKRIRKRYNFNEFFKKRLPKNMPVSHPGGKGYWKKNAKHFADVTMDPSEAMHVSIEKIISSANILNERVISNSSSVLAEDEEINMTFHIVPSKWRVGNWLTGGEKILSRRVGANTDLYVDAPGVTTTPTSRGTTGGLRGARVLIFGHSQASKYYHGGPIVSEIAAAGGTVSHHKALVGYSDGRGGKFPDKRLDMAIQEVPKKDYTHAFLFLGGNTGVKGPDYKKEKGDIIKYVTGPLNIPKENIVVILPPINLDKKNYDRRPLNLRARLIFNSLGVAVAPDTVGREEDFFDGLHIKGSSKIAKESIASMISDVFAKDVSGVEGVADTGDEIDKGVEIPYSFIMKNLGINKSTWDLYRKTVGRIESANQYHIIGGAGDHYDGRYQAGKVAKTGGARRFGIPDPGHDPEQRKAFRGNPSLQEKILAGFTVGNDKILRSKNKKYRTIEDPIERLKILGIAHQGWTSASKYLNTGVSGKDKWGTEGTEYYNALDKALRRRPTRYSPINTNDTSDLLSPVVNEDLGLRKFTGIGGVRSASPEKAYAQLSSINFLNDLSKVGDGKWTIGDMTSEIGGRIMAHKSHQTGLDIDVAIPYADGSTSIFTQAGDPDKFSQSLKKRFGKDRERVANKKWEYENYSSDKNVLDVDKILGMLSLAKKHGATLIISDQSIINDLRAAVRQRANISEAVGETPEELIKMLYNDTKGMHKDHFHIRMPLDRSLCKNRTACNTTYIHHWNTPEKLLAYAKKHNINLRNLKPISTGDVKSASAPVKSAKKRRGGAKYSYIIGSLYGDEIYDKFNEDRAVAHGASMNKPIIALIHMLKYGHDPIKRMTKQELDWLLAYTGGNYSNYVNAMISGRLASKTPPGAKNKLKDRAKVVGKISDKIASEYLGKLGLDPSMKVRYYNNKQTAAQFFDFMKLLHDESRIKSLGIESEVALIVQYMKRLIPGTSFKDRESKKWLDFANKMTNKGIPIKSIYGKGGVIDHGLHYSFVINDRHLLSIYSDQGGAFPGSRWRLYKVIEEVLAKTLGAGLQKESKSMELIFKLIDEVQDSAMA